MRIFSDDFQSLGLTPIQKLIYLFLSSESDDDGYIRISTNEISSRVGCSRVSVSNSLSHLDSLSLISIYRGTSIGHLSSYSVLDPFKKTQTKDSSQCSGTSQSKVQKNRKNRTWSPLVRN